MKNTKLFALLLCAVLTISMLATGCSGGGENSPGIL